MSWRETCGVPAQTAQAPITAGPGQTQPRQSHVPARASTWERMRMSNFYTEAEKRYRSQSRSGNSSGSSEEDVRHRRHKHPRPNLREGYH